MKKTSLSFGLNSNWRVAGRVFGVVLTLFLDAVCASPAYASESDTRSFIQIVKGALISHPTVMSKIVDQQAAAQGVDLARLQRYPNFIVQPSLSSSGNLEGGYRLQAPIWNGGRINAEISSAQSLENAARFSVQESKQLLHQRIIAAYGDMARSAAKLEFANENIMENERMVRSMERRVEAGASSQADLTLSIGRLLQVRRDYIGINAQLLAAKNTFRQVTGYDSRIEMPVAPAKFDLPTLPEIVEKSISYSPVLLRIDSEISAADSEVKAKRAGLYPQIVARYESARVSGQVVSRTAIALEYQTGGGFSAFKMVEQSESRRESLKFTRKNQERELLERIHNDWQEAKSLSEQIQYISKYVEAQLEVFESMKRQFQAGRRSWLDVLNAQREYVSAKYEQADALWAHWHAASKVMAGYGFVLTPDSGLVEAIE